MSKTTKFPYWAFERLNRTIVKVVSIEGGMATLEDGTKAWLEVLTRPDWLADAQHAAADLTDELDTQKCATERTMT